MHDAVPAQEVRGTLPDSVTQSGVDRRLDDSRMVGEPQVVVAAERQVFAPVHHDARSLRADAAAHKAAALDFGELVGESLKDQGEDPAARGRAAHACGLRPASAFARHIGQARL